jgi:hybrid cluster-associated redox disulfide protein
MEITRTMTINDVVEKAPKSVALLMEAGMGCLGCHMAAMETLEEGCKAHGLKDKDIDELLKKINSH